mmetsp:Transcript_25129/g.58444  ORF Transcript_25129/g.58444 Transcript_25129/m.58444 type:complete len:93 (+) Transcript_25129:606-884(+)
MKDLYNRWKQQAVAVSTYIITTVCYSLYAAIDAISFSFQGNPSPPLSRRSLLLGRRRLDTSRRSFLYCFIATSRSFPPLSNASTWDFMDSHA